MHKDAQGLSIDFNIKMSFAREAKSMGIDDDFVINTSD